MNILAKNLLILASAGSGKTFQLSNRIIGLIAQGADPEHIVALTFTRKAAAEFAESVLTKLAEAATNEAKAAGLCKELNLPSADFKEALAKVTHSLHRITLGTMDSFFAKIIRGFQYELGLTGGKFDLIEGPQADIMADEILASILGDVMSSDRGDEFSHAFRRANTGKEQQGIAKSLREFIRIWHHHSRHQPNLVWGPDHLTHAQPHDWEKQKNALAHQVLDGIDHIEFTRKGQREAFEKSIESLRDHTIGSGSLGDKASSLTKNMLEAVSAQSGEVLTLKSYKEFEIHDPTTSTLREMVELAAHCELAAAIQRTRAIREVVDAYDQHCATRLRHQGRLGFDDIKLLMGEWATSEDARLRRELVDFRLDARYHHWLLDEFQDTSRADWNGLFPLVDEAAADPDNSVFIVGDRKQAIYAWRGGDVSLFDEVIERYANDGNEGDDHRLQIEPLNESWRSCPQVLDLVNQVCGNQSEITRIFGEVGSAWKCPEHLAAKPLQQTDKQGHAQVEVVGSWEERLERMAEILNQLGVGKRQMTCGILLRGNDKAKEVADYLRAHPYKFDVILEGHREPGKDTPVGIVVTQLLKWLADPADTFARMTLEMSPLAATFKQQDGESWRDIWSGLTAQISREGYHHTVSHLLDACGTTLSEFGRRRADDVLTALASFDQQGGITARQAAVLVDRLEVSQSPGTAAIQVMTIHKSKGLGFDVVILPDIPTKKVPSASDFDIAFGDNWLTQAPPHWAREIISELKQSEEKWAITQQHEALCTLYVALTRSKRGLYVLLDQPGGKHDYGKPSLENWIINTTGVTQKEPMVQGFGNLKWSELIPEECNESPPPSSAKLIAPNTTSAGRESVSNPSNLVPIRRQSAEGKRFGTEVHALLEGIGWIDDAAPPLPDSPAGRVIQALFDNPASRASFERQGRNIQLHREQAVDAIIDGQFTSGVIDRLHLHRDSSGKVIAADIIDFKTDAANDPNQLKEIHRNQIDYYRQCIQQLYPAAKMNCWLLCTHSGTRLDL